MLLDIVSYNGHNINDGTNFNAWFPWGQPAGPSAEPVYAPRARTWQKLSNKQIGAATLSFHIECRGTIHTQLETLKSWFPIDDFTPRQLIVKDTADGNRQWYVKGYAVAPIAPVEEGAGEYVMTLALDEPLWRTVTADSTSWNITATAQTKSLTLLGNETARPKLTMDINGSKVFGYAYRLWRHWYNPLTVESAEPLEATNGGLNTTNLIADTSKSNQLNGAIDASVLSFAVDTAVGGGLPAGGGMCKVDNEQIYYTSISGGTMTVPAGGRGYGGTTAASHADNAVLNFSQLMANLQDLRVFVDQVEVDSWHTGAGSATKIWINQKFQPKIELTLSSAIASGTTAPSFAVNITPTTDNLAALKRLPRAFPFTIDNELFVGYAVDPANSRFFCWNRALRGTSAANHSVGAVIRVIEHDIFIVWGDPLASAQVTDDTRKPVIDLTNSTNASWAHASFASNDGLRTGDWKPYTLLKGPNSTLYTNTHAAFADPAAVMGIAGLVWTLNALPKADNIAFYWKFFHPAGITTVTMSGEKRRLSTDWPATIGLLSSAAGAPWAWVFQEAAPASSGSWLSLASHSSIALAAGTSFLYFFCSGSVAAVTGNEVDIEISDDTLVFTSANVMQIGLSASAESSYLLDATISVVETGDSMRLRGILKTTDRIIVDCDAETITQNGADANVAVAWNTIREGWLNLPSPQQSATCTLKYEETGVTNVDIAIDRENRNAL